MVWRHYRRDLHTKVVDVMTPVLFPANATTFATQGFGALSDAISCTVMEERNGEFELEMQYPQTGVHFADISDRCIITAIPSPWRTAQPFRIYRITKPMNGVCTIYARHITYDLGGIPVNVFSAQNVASALAGLKSNSAAENPFEFWTDKTTTANFAVTTPAALRSRLGGKTGSILDVYGGEYEWDGMTVKLHNNRGTDRGVTIRYGKNLTDIEQDRNIANVRTGIYPYWINSDGVLVVCDPPVVNAPGSYDFANIETVDFSQDFEEQPTPAQLKERAEQYISANNIGVPSVNISVSFVDLSQTDQYKGLALLEQCDLCDTVTVQFEALGVNATAEIVRIETDVLLGRYKAIEVGSLRTNITDTIVSNNQATNEKIDKTTSWLEKQVQEATDQITNGGGYIYRVYDANKNLVEIGSTDNLDLNKAVHVWRWNNGGFGYSGTGYNGPYRTAITQDGHIVADFIDTGTLNAALVNVINLVADNIKSGTISSVDGQQLWNLDEGYFQSSGPVDGVPGSTYKTVLDASKLGFYANGVLRGTITGGVYSIAQNGYNDRSDGNRIAYHNSSGVTVNVFSDKIPKQRLQVTPGVIYTADEYGNLFNCNLSTGDFQLVNRGTQLDANSSGFHFTNSSIDFNVNGDGIVLNGKQWIRTSGTTTMMTFAADKNQPNYYLYYGVTNNTAGGSDNVWTLCPFNGGYLQLGTQKQPWGTSYIQNLYLSNILQVQNLYVYDANSGTYRKAVWKYQSAIDATVLCME